MTEKSDERNNMLTVVYQMLPHISEEYAQQLVRTLEHKKTIAQLQQDIANTAAQLNSDSIHTDNLVAKILVDQITPHAALRQLRIYNNATSIDELAATLQLPESDRQKLLQVYASFSSRKYFDQEFATALKDLQTQGSLSDEQKASHALRRLLTQADQWLAQQQPFTSQNEQDILTLADTYHLSFQITQELLCVYTQPGSICFKQEMEQLLNQLQPYNAHVPLCVSLAAQVMLGKLTAQNAQDVALVSNLVNGQILEEDLIILACRYLKTKTPNDIVTAFKAVLGRLPYARVPAENLGLAVRVLLEGTPESLQAACQLASQRQTKEMLRRQLSQHELYTGYEADLAEHFAGQKTLPQLQQALQDTLDTLPFYEDKNENKELACKILLGTLTPQEAYNQAQYLRDLKAQTVTKGLAPDLMKSYLGTQSADEIIQFFEQTLAPYTFWKANRKHHEFALRVLLGELNGTYNRQISKFVLDMLEKGSSTGLIADMLSNLQTHNTNKEDLDNLLKMYERTQKSALP